MADGAELACSRWTDCAAQRSSWRGANLRQAVFEDFSGRFADFAQANLTGARWLRVGLSDLELGGATTLGWQAEACQGPGLDNGRPAVGHDTLDHQESTPRQTLLAKTELALPSHTGPVWGCAVSADGTLIATASHDGTARLWARSGKCLFQWNPATGSRIWLDAETETLQFDGPDWPLWQLVNPDPAQPNLLGCSIHRFGPHAHERLANAADWDFAPLAAAR
jgi:hypothetical protein